MKSQTPLDSIINSHPTWALWSASPEDYQVQVMLTEIERTQKGEIILQSFDWGHKPGEYFYPASTIKMPVAALALQRLNELGIQGLDPHSTMRTGRGRSPQTTALADTTAKGGLPSIAHYIRQIFLVSDNQAYNRLFEFLGQAYINEGLQKIGLHNSRILHRVGVSGFDTLANRYLNPVGFWQEDTLLYYQGERY
ncbi:MAG: serine hydrolase, partial [Bacteroidota bacterium]